MSMMTVMELFREQIYQSLANNNQIINDITPITIIPFMKNDDKKNMSQKEFLKKYTSVKFYTVVINALAKFPNKSEQPVFILYFVHRNNDLYTSSATYQINDDGIEIIWQTPIEPFDENKPNHQKPSIEDKHLFELFGE